MIIFCNSYGFLCIAGYLLILCFERNHISRQSGKVQFYHVYAGISNFTNDKKAIAVNNVMTVDMSSSFLNKTPLKVTWLFYLLHPRGRFDLKGASGAIDAVSLNALTVPMGPARIKEGKINGVEFNLQGNDYGMDGTVKMLYKDLKVTMLEKDKGSMKLDKKALVSFIANILIKNSNPKRNEDVRIVQVHLDHDLNHSIYYLACKTIFKGMKAFVASLNYSLLLQVIRQIRKEWKVFPLYLFYRLPTKGC